MSQGAGAVTPGAIRGRCRRSGRGPGPGRGPWCLAPLLLLAGACDLTRPDDPSLITVATDQAVYQVGEEAVVTVTNGTPNPVRFHPNAARVARAVGGGWERLEALWPRTGIPLVNLAPGRSTTLHVPVGTLLRQGSQTGPLRPSPLQPGHTYRVEVDVEALASQVESITRVRSRSFSVLSWGDGPRAVGSARHRASGKGEG